MDGRVPKSFSRLEDISHHGSLAESVRVRRGIVPVLGSNSTCCKFSVDQGRRKGAETSILHKQST